MSGFKQLLKKMAPVGLLLGFGIIAFGLGFSIQQKKVLGKTVSQVENLKEISLEELSAFNGNNPSKPIYIGLNGLVYDVSAGKQFYSTGGVYHDLAGRDSSSELNIFGGAIIKSKYPVVARLAK